MRFEPSVPTWPIVPKKICAELADQKSAGTSDWNATLELMIVGSIDRMSLAPVRNRIGAELSAARRIPPPALRKLR